jgi:hypothetical protein
MHEQHDLTESEFLTLHGLSKRILWHNHATRRRLQSLGVNIVPANFYSEIPTHDEIDRAFEYRDPVPFSNSMFDAARAREYAMSLVPYCADFDPPTEKHLAGENSFFWKCPAFSSCDAMAYYGMIRKHRPKTVLEIGSGYSTMVACHSVKDCGCGRVVSIEPYPKEWLSRLPVELRQEVAQNISPEYVNDTLADGDVLFIDSTHTVKCGSDVVHLILRVLPFLRRKLFVHVHDIYLPYGLPKKSLTETQIYWTEQYLLMAYMLDNPKAEFLFSNVILCQSAPDAAKAMMHGRWAIGGSSFWLALNPATSPATKSEEFGNPP